MEQQQIRQAYRELDREISLLFYQLRGTDQYECEPFAPNRETLALFEEKLNQLKQRADSLPDTDRPAMIFKIRFHDVLDETKRQSEEIRRHPGLLMKQLTSEFSNLIRLDSRSPKERLEVISQRCACTQAIDEAVNDLLQECCDEIRTETADMYVEQCNILDELCNEAAESFNALRDPYPVKIKLQMQAAAFELFDMAQKYRTESSPASERCSREDYIQMLSVRYGIDYDNLKRDCNYDIELTRMAVFEALADTDAEKYEKQPDMTNAVLVLNKYAGAMDQADDIWPILHNYMSRARKAAHEYVKLPDDEECRFRPVPAVLKETYPWGGYEGGDTNRRPIRGQMFVNQLNYKAVTDGWLKMMAVHECYPGHHVQFIRSITDRTPETVKIDAKAIPLIEGTAMRSETVFADIYSDDPYYGLFAAYRRHHAAVRVKVDLMLFDQQCSEEECISTYVKELGFDRQTAKGQVKAHLEMPGYFACYQYGLKMIDRAERACGLDSLAFSELLFSAGYISIKEFEAFVQLNEEERRSYLNDYPSLLRNFSNTVNLNG